LLLRIAFDASGKKGDSAFMVVAGFLSSVTDWADFTSRWTDRLQQDKIEVFRASQMYRYFSDESDTVQRQKRNSLLDDLMEIIQSHVYHKTGCVIELKNLERIPSETREKYRLQEYAYAARSCVGHTREWFERNRWFDRHVEYIFEDGDEGKGDLEARFEADGYGRPEFRPKKDQVRPDGTISAGFVPLQAADWLAHVYFVVYRAFLDGDYDKQQTWAYREFERMDGRFYTLTADAADELTARIKIVEETRYLEDLVPEKQDDSSREE
jgi:hypothetical protein